MAQWLKKGDKVLIITGNDKGRTGTVLRCKANHVIVQGMNIRKKHMKRQSQVQTRSIVEIEMPIHRSNVCLCDEEGKPFHVKVKQKGREKELIYQQGDKEVSFRTLRKS